MTFWHGIAIGFAIGFSPVVIFFAWFFRAAYRKEIPYAP